ncbi:MAG: GFA family protein [Pseudomonadota bacterium]
MSEIIGDGGCLCGAVRYTVKGELLWSGHCHCETCRRQTSSPITTFFAIYEKDMMFHGEDDISIFVSSKGVERGFCSKCGTPMFYKTSARPGEINLYAVSLDLPDKFTPQVHYHWQEKLPWTHWQDSLPKYDGD